MSLYIRQKAMSLVDRFSVMDEQGNEKYYVEGELLFFGRRLHIFDVTGAEVGRGERPADDMARILQSQSRAEAGFTAPAQGLCLMRVEY